MLKCKLLELKSDTFTVKKTDKHLLPDVYIPTI